MRANTFLPLCFVVCVACQPPASVAPVAVETPHQTQQAEGFSGTAVFLRNWRWSDIMQNMQALKAMQFTALLISPHTATCGADQSEGYDPSDFTQFGSRFGNEDELSQLVGSAH